MAEGTIDVALEIHRVRQGAEGCVVSTHVHRRLVGGVNKRVQPLAQRALFRELVVAQDLLSPVSDKGIDRIADIVGRGQCAGLQMRSDILLDAIFARSLRLFERTKEREEFRGSLNLGHCRRPSLGQEERVSSSVGHRLETALESVDAARVNAWTVRIETQLKRSRTGGDSSDLSRMSADLKDMVRDADLAMRHRFAEEAKGVRESLQETTAVVQTRRRRSRRFRSLYGVAVGIAVCGRSGRRS